jgi:hemoglobin-like flavoprotein
MIPDSAALVAESLDRVRAATVRGSTLFYERLFEIHPPDRMRFAHMDAAARRDKLDATVTAVARLMTDAERTVPDLAASGRRHQEHGLGGRDYDAFGDALVWLLERELGAGFPDDVRSAWREGYRTLVAVMGRGAARAAGPSSRPLA